MKLFDQSETYVPQLSAEQFTHMYCNARVVSTEGVGVFLGHIKDAFAGAIHTVDPNTQRLTKDTLQRRHAAVAKAKEVEFAHFRQHVVSKPESFKGYYTDYAQQLAQSTQQVYAQCAPSIDALKMTIAVFINDYEDGKLDRLSQQKHFDDAVRVLAENKEKIKKFFPLPAAKVKAPVHDLIRSMGDIEQLYDQVPVIAELFSDSRQREINQQAKSASELVDALLEANQTSGILNKTDSLKQSLVQAVHACAQLVEYYYALLSQWLFFSKAIDNLSQDLLKHP